MKHAKWLWVVLIAACLGAASREDREASSNLNKPPPVITDVQEISRAKVPESLASRSVKLTQVSVLNIYDERLVSVGSAGAAVLVRLVERLKGLKKGAVLDLGGVLSQTPVQLQAWNLDAQIAKEIQHYPVFVNASTASIRPSTTRPRHAS